MQTGKRMAKKLAARGRGGDSMLVHMHPNEVKALAGLGALAGTPMTRNPDTGLPEAFNLREALALAAPVAATMLTGNPMIGAAASGLTTYATTGDTQQALMSGIAAGAMGSALSGLGGEAAGQAAGQGAAQGGAQGAQQVAAQEAATQAGQQAAAQGAAQTATAPATTEVVPGMTDAATGANYDVALTSPEVSMQAPTVTTPTWGDMTLSERMDALKNANWSSKGGPLLTEQGGVRTAPMIAAGAYLGLQGLNEQQRLAEQQKRASARSYGNTKARFDYYKRMANTMPANQIPAYPY